MLTAVISILGASASASTLTADGVRAEFARDPDALVERLITATANWPAGAFPDADATRLAQFVARRARVDERVLASPERVMTLLGPAGTAELVRRINAWMDFDDQGGPAMYAQLDFVDAATTARGGTACASNLAGVGPAPSSK